MSIKYNHYLKSAYTLENILKNTVFQYLDSIFQGPVIFNVSVPKNTEKAEWNLNGQSISLTLPLTDTVRYVVI